MDVELARAGDPASYLPESINFTARMLESLFADASTSRQFVDQGGIEALLAIYTLPRLPPTFGSSAPAQALMAAMRSFTAAHADTVSVHLNRMLLAQLQVAIARAKVGPRVRPSLPPSWNLFRCLVSPKKCSPAFSTSACNPKCLFVVCESCAVG